MPNWVSILGKQYPRKEYAVNPNAPKGQEIYEGPDRAATEVLKNLGVDYLGQDYHTNPELIRQSRELGYKSVDEFLKEMYGFDAAEAEKKAKAILADEVDYRQKDRPVPPITPPSGGDDTSGQGNHVRGGFGEPKGIQNPSDLKQRA